MPWSTLGPRACITRSAGEGSGSGDLETEYPKEVPVDSIQFVGIDVSAKQLTVQIEDSRATPGLFEFANTPAGHRKLIKKLIKKGHRARVCMEWTGNYSLDLALTLAKTPGIELMVLNPRAAHDFAQAYLKRSKTDKVDSLLLLEFVKRMPFRAFQPPSLNAVARHCPAHQCVDPNEHSREKPAPQQ
jgi:hypothetical protein